MSSIRFAGAFALGALACGARTDVGGAASTSDASVEARFPVGTYTRCAFGTVSPGPFLIPSGFVDGATMTVTESGDTRTATFAEDSKHVASWTFTTTTSASSTLSPSEQTSDGFGESICVYGVGVSNEKFFPTKLDAISGALTYESGVMFVSLAGDVTSHTDCGDVTAPASAWITCAGGPAPAITAAASAAPFPTGDYACASQVGTHSTEGGKNAFITSGEKGTLTLTQTGAQMTAKYAGDAEITGALDLTLDGSSSGHANANASQTLTARCGLDVTTGELSIAAASLTAEGGTIFLSIAGNMSVSSACPSTEKIATLVCTKP